MCQYVLAHPIDNRCFWYRSITAVFDKILDRVLGQ